MIGIDRNGVAQEDIAILFERFHDGEKFSFGSGVGNLCLFKLLAEEGDGFTFLADDGTKLEFRSIRVDFEGFGEIGVRQEDIPRDHEFNVVEGALFYVSPTPLYVFGEKRRKGRQEMRAMLPHVSIEID